MSREILKKWMELWRLTDSVYAAFLRRWKLSLTAYFAQVWLKENLDGAVDALDLRDLAVFSKKEQEQLLEFSRRFYEAVREK